MPLPADTRQSLEGRFGADFSSVRIHTGAQAERLSSGIQAQAFTQAVSSAISIWAYRPADISGRKASALTWADTLASIRPAFTQELPSERLAPSPASNGKAPR